VSAGTACPAMPRAVADGAEDTALARINISQFANRARHEANPCPTKKRRFTRIARRPRGRSRHRRASGDAPQAHAV